MSTTVKDEPTQDFKAEPFIEISDFTLESVREGGEAETLYHSCELSADHGDFVLLLGPSGAGKSLLTNFILNLASPVSETLIVNQGDLRRPKMLLKLPKPGLQGTQEIDVFKEDLYPEELRAHVGVMFQKLGLLDDLSVAENLEYANDQCAHPKPREEWLNWRTKTFARLGLNEGLLHEPVGKLSGGQQQRVALGRMLAYAPKIMIFDEPTSALDPLSAQDAVQLIREAHDQSGAALTLVITHDYDNFLSVADRVWFLTQGRHFLNEQPPARAEEYEKRLRQTRIPSSRPLTLDEKLSHEAKIADRQSEIALERATNTMSRGLHSIGTTWFMRYLKTFTKRVIIEGLPFHLIAGLGLGAVATYFSFNMELGSVAVQGGTEVEVSHFVLPTFFEQMLSGFGIVLYRALIPLFTCICVAARSGTAITAYLSEMRDEGRKQWDAMESFGVPPSWFFLPQILFVFSIGCFILSYLSFLLASVGSLLVAMGTNPLCTYYTWVNTYWENLHPRAGFWFAGSGFFILKTVTAGLCIGLISFYYGTRKRKSSLDTMTNLSKANVYSVLITLLVFFLFLIAEA